MTVNDFLKLNENDLPTIMKVEYLPYSYKHRMVSLFLDAFIKDKSKVSYDSSLLYRAFNQVVIETYYDLKIEEADELGLDGYDLLELTDMLNNLLYNIDEEYGRCKEILKMQLEDIHREYATLEAVVNRNLENLLSLIDKALEKLTESNQKVTQNLDLDKLTEAFETLKSMNK